MPTTPTYSLPYPAPTDPPDVPTDMNELATAVETALSTQVTALDARLDTIEPTVPASRVAPGTNGQVLTTTAGAAAWATPATASPGIVLIEEKILGANGAIDFTGIPGTYRHLRLVAFLRTITAVALDPLLLNVNGSAVSAYQFYGASSTTNSAGAGSLGSINGASAGATVFSPVTIEFPFYAVAGVSKTGLSQVGTFSTQNAGYAGNWYVAATAAITRVTPTAAGVFGTGSRAALYGIN